MAGCLRDSWFQSPLWRNVDTVGKDISQGVTDERKVEGEMSAVIVFKGIFWEA